MKAITTKYLGPTDTKGSRICASDGDGNRVTIPYRTDEDPEGNHMRAAASLCNRMQWFGTIQGGHTQEGMCWTWIDDRYQTTVSKTGRPVGFTVPAAPVAPAR